MSITNPINQQPTILARAIILCKASALLLAFFGSNHRARVGQTTEKVVGRFIEFIFVERLDRWMDPLKSLAGKKKPGDKNPLTAFFSRLWLRPVSHQACH